MEKHRRPGNSFFPKQTERRMAMGRELRIQVGENKEDSMETDGRRRQYVSTKAPREKNSQRERERD